MFRIYALTIASFAVLAMTLGAGAARAASMMAPSTGRITGDWDIDTDATMHATLSQARSLASQFFRVQWTSKVDGRGQSRITGYVYDDYGEPATNVRLQISMLDATGREIASVIRPVQGTIPGEGNVYFDVAVSDSPSYRVSVISFDFVEPGKGK